MKVLETITWRMTLKTRSSPLPTSFITEWNDFIIKHVSPSLIRPCPLSSIVFHASTSCVDFSFYVCVRVAVGVCLIIDLKYPVWSRGFQVFPSFPRSQKRKISNREGNEIMTLQQLIPIHLDRPRPHLVGQAIDPPVRSAHRSRGYAATTYNFDAVPLGMLTVRNSSCRSVPPLPASPFPTADLTDTRTARVFHGRWPRLRVPPILTRERSSRAKSTSWSWKVRPFGHQGRAGLWSGNSRIHT